MKRLIVSAILLVSAAFAQADVTLNLGGGNLYTAGGASLAPSGSLVQLLVSTGDGVFSNPTPNSFVGGSTDDFVLASFSVNPDGQFAQPITFTLGVNNVTTNDLLLLRWYPALTTAATMPGAGTQYGEFRTNNVESFSDISWVVPNDGTFTLNFLTDALGGPNPESAGFANLVVVPEPSTVALLAFGGVAGAVALLRRRK